MKAVIVAAGYGSRFLPVTKVVPKELLPVVDRPALAWILDELTEAGVDEVLVITSRRKRAIEDWFDRAPELEVALAHKPWALERIRPPGLRVQFVRQQRMGGTGDALLLARSFAGSDPVLVAFPDDLFVGPNCSAALIRTWERTGCAVLAAAELDGDLSRYGVIETCPREDGELGVRRIVEKPAPGEAPSRLVSFGRYLYTPALFEALERRRETHEGGEYYPAGAIAELGEQGAVVAARVDARRYDTGQPLDYLQTVVELAVRDPHLGPAFEAFLRRRFGG